MVHGSSDRRIQHVHAHECARACMCAPPPAPPPPGFSCDQNKRNSPQAGCPAGQGVQGPLPALKDGHTVHQVARGGGGGRLVVGGGGGWGTTTTAATAPPAQQPAQRG
jgi:hypothetical protein